MTVNKKFNKFLIIFYINLCNLEKFKIILSNIKNNKNNYNYNYKKNKRKKIIYKKLKIKQKKCKMNVNNFEKN